MALRYLFVDMNAYFASVEQQDDPRLRDRPVAVVPVQARTTCCLAVSYEGRKFGVKTGTPVWQAEQLCPEMRFVVARPRRYVEVHHELVRAVGQYLPVAEVLSVDEMACRLIGEERRPERAATLARSIKAEIRRRFDHLTCSVGVGPNVMLAKVAADMRKPDGLTLLTPEDMARRLAALKLTDFPGIGPRMEQRLRRHGVWDTRRLLELTPAQMSRAWGSRVHGWRWWHLLRGEDVPAKPTRRQTVGQSHVLPPDLRTDDGARGVLVRLIHKAAARMRDLGYWTGALSVSVRYEGGGRWDAGCHLPKCQDTLGLLRAFAALWERRPEGRPTQVSVVLSDLVPARSATPSLFEDERQAGELSHTMDRINRLFGKNLIRFGTLCGSEHTAPTRIPFAQIPKFNPAFG